MESSRALYRFQWRALTAPLSVPIFWVSHKPIEIKGVFNSGSIWDKQVSIRARELALFREGTYQALAAFSLFPFFFRLFEALYSAFQWRARELSIGFNGELQLRPCLSQYFECHKTPLKSMEFSIAAPFETSKSFWELASTFSWGNPPSSCCFLAFPLLLPLSWSGP